MRLIDADRALEIVRDQGIAHPNAYHLTNYATLILLEAPTIEAKPVVHGEWLDAPYVYFGAKRYVCSECKDSEFWEARFVIVKENYCPNCGADMRERKEA